MPINPPYNSAIERNPGKYDGTAVIRGTRIPVYQLVEYIEEGYTFQQFAEWFGVDPELAKEAYKQSGLEDLAAGEKVSA